MPRPMLELLGVRFGRLVAQWPVGFRGKAIVWLCSCDCGELNLVRAQTLSRGHAKSCGCFVSERMRLRNPAIWLHGHARKTKHTSEYRTWSGMVQRCFNPQNTNYKYYGARGITVCDRWRTFENFIADMGRRPPGLSLDRIQNDGNYEPGNCRWTTASVQNNNKRQRKSKRSQSCQ